MKKRIRLTENDLMGIVKKVIKENKEENFINKVDKFIEIPYFYNLESIGVPEHLWNKILSNKFNQEVIIIGTDVYDSNGKQIYYEDSDGRWVKREYDSNGNIIYYENSNGYWVKMEYDSNGKQIYSENSYGTIVDRRTINESVDISDNKRFNDYVINDVIKNTSLIGHHFYLFDCNISIHLNHSRYNPFFEWVPECFYTIMDRHYGLDFDTSNKVWSWYSEYIIDLYLKEFSR